jgi:hypothetical protein
MKATFVLIAAMLVLPTTFAHAQGPPRACRIFIEVEDGKITSETQTTSSCFFGAKIVFLAVNLDNEEYDIVLEKFRFDANKPAACSGTAPDALPPPINGASEGKRFKIGIGKQQGNHQKKTIYSGQGNMRECYKYDIVLLDDDGNEIDRMDPELEMALPPPPPQPPPPAPGAKPKPPGGVQH